MQSAENMVSLVFVWMVKYDSLKEWKMQELSEEAKMKLNERFFLDVLGISLRSLVEFWF